MILEWIQSPWIQPFSRPVREEDPPRLVAFPFDLAVAFFAHSRAAVFSFPLSPARRVWSVGAGGVLRKPWCLLRRRSLQKLVAWGKGLSLSWCVPLRRLIFLNRGGDLCESFLVLFCLGAGSYHSLGPRLLPNRHQGCAG